MLIKLYINSTVFKRLASLEKEGDSSVLGYYNRQSDSIEVIIKRSQITDYVREEAVYFCHPQLRQK